MLIILCMCVCIFPIAGRHRDMDLPADEVMVEAIAPFKDSKEPEMTIGSGMELTIPGIFPVTSRIPRSFFFFF